MLFNLRLPALTIALLSLMMSFPGTGHSLAVLSPTRVQEGPKIDGILDEAIWSSAFEAGDLTVIEPNSGKHGVYQTRVKMAYDEKALYLGVISEQPVDTHVRRVSARDQKNVSRDTFRVILDPSGHGRYAYLFEVALGGSLLDGTVRSVRDYSYSWDSPWQAATSSDADQWYAEIEIPWDVMELPDKEGERRLGVYLQRQVPHLGEYWALPAIPFTSQVFLASLATTVVDDINPGGRLTFYPYAAVGYDGIAGKSKESIGTDVFWQPSSNLLVSATVNPDFGQVENDEVVVNFGATETFLQDKRPFFVEGNDIFQTHNLRIVHTRRIGETPESPEILPGEFITRAPLVSDIFAATKVTGQKRNLRFGFMMAFEDDSDFTVNGTRDIIMEGQDFYTGRALYEHNGGNGNVALGYLGTFTRLGSSDAWVHSIDAQWLTGDKKYRMEGQVAVSDVEDSQGHAWNGKITYTPTTSTTYRLSLDYADVGFDINDMGYIERNDRLKFNASYAKYRFDLPQFQRLSWSYRALGEANDHLLKMDIGGQMYFKFHNVTRLFTELYYRPAAWNDLDSHGNGDFRTKEGFLAYLSWTSDTSKPLRMNTSFRASTEKNGGPTYRLRARPAFDIMDTWQVELDIKFYDRQGWILWQGDNRMDGFDATQLEVELDSNFQLSTKQEIRLGIQWVGIDAVDKTTYRIDDNGYLRESGEEVGSRSFDWAELAVQIRYKYEFAPLSDLFLVYSRGSLVYWGASSKTNDFAELLSDSIEDRDVDRFLLKVRYRF